MSKTELLCHICQHTFTPSEKIGPLKEYNYFTCPNCQGGTIDPYPKQEGFQKLYSEESYYQGLSAPASNHVIDSLLNLRTYELPSEYVAQLKSSGKALDVGCGNGEFLSELKARGWSVWGADISDIAVKNTQRRTGETDHIIHEEFSQLEISQSFDVISFWHVLEHINNVSEYLSKAFKLLESDGYIVGEVPNYNSFTFRLFKADYAWVMVPEHIIYFSRHSLELMLNQAGFKNVKVSCPNRAVLNFSYSLKRYFEHIQMNSNLAKILFLLSLPCSFLVGILSSIFGQGEVLRFYAQK